MWRTDSLEKILILGKKAGGKGDGRRWDGWMASLTRWTWVCTSFRCWWWTGKPGVMRSMGSQRVGLNWATELNWFCLMTWGRDSIAGLILVIYPNWHHQPVLSKWDHSQLASSFIYLFIFEYFTLASGSHSMYVPWWFSMSCPCPFYSENLLWSLQGRCKVDSGL